jgi:hypothetical protein
MFDAALMTVNTRAMVGYRDELAIPRWIFWTAGMRSSRRRGSSRRGGEEAEHSARQAAWPSAGAAATEDNFMPVLGDGRKMENDDAAWTSRAGG